VDWGEGGRVHPIFARGVPEINAEFADPMSFFGRGEGSVRIEG